MWLVFGKMIVILQIVKEYKFICEYFSNFNGLKIFSNA